MMGITEIIIIAIVLIILLFGGKKITEIARGMGKFTSEYKKGKMEAEEELDKIKEEKNTVLK
jgi:sec-independent protein translocase protein TatA